MKSIKKYFTKPTLFKKFLTFLFSPIHWAKMNYKKNYHLNFTHAKKLFIFDMSLLAFVIFLIGVTIFWFNYHPNIDQLVYLDINPSKDKIMSGDYIDYKITYKNESDKKLISPILTLKLPKNFLIEKIEPAKYNKSKNIFELPNLKPNDEGSIIISGWAYGTPDTNELITTILSYRQDSRKVKEQKTVAFIKTLRNSVLNTEINISDKILSQGKTPITISLENIGEKNLHGISLLLPSTKEINFSNIQTDNGETKNNLWTISELSPKQKNSLTADIITDIKNYQKEITLNFTPNLTVNESSVPQKTISKVLALTYPQAQISVTWQNNLKQIKPTGVATLEMEIKNIGNITFTNAQIEIPLISGLIDSARINKLNLGKISNGAFIIDKNNLPALSEIKPNDSFKYNIQIPIVYWPQGGVDQTLNLSPRFQSELENITSAKYELSAQSPSIAIGTQLSLEAETRYYTNEGDQIGRGPLPARVGKETKYWAMLKIQNATSQIKNLNLSAELPDYIFLTGKSSVSHGQDISYDSVRKKINWTLADLPAYAQVGVYFELSLTPTSEMIGTTPIILKNITLTGTDNYLQESITQTIPNIDISLPNDQIGKEKGIIIIQ